MILGLIGFFLLIVLCLLSVPVAIALGVIGIGAAWIIYGSINGAYLAGLTAWSSSWSWALVMLPLFILMGSLAAVSQLGRDAFD